MWNVLWKLFAPWGDNCSSFPGWWSHGLPCMSSARLADCTWLPEYWAESLLWWLLVVEAAGVHWRIGSRFNTFSYRTSTDLSKVAVRVHDCVGSLCKMKLLCLLSRTLSVSIFGPSDRTICTYKAPFLKLVIIKCDSPWWFLSIYSFLAGCLKRHIKSASETLLHLAMPPPLTPSIPLAYGVILLVESLYHPSCYSLMSQTICISPTRPKGDQSAR